MSTAARTTTAALPRRAWVEQIMGMPISVHVRDERAHSSEVAAAVGEVFSELMAVDATFSPYRPDSQVCRLQRGELRLADASAEVQEVELLCRAALERTGGWFDAWRSRPSRPGIFGPTGLVKTWATSRAARHLDALDVGYALGAGGDVLLRGAADGEPWLVGVEDPRDRTRVLATVPVTDGGVATSGTAARGAHIVDPRTTTPVTEVLSATVVGPSLMWADVFATAAVAMGRAAGEWVASLHGTSGMLVLADGTVHRWGNPV